MPSTTTRAPLSACRSALAQGFRNSAPQTFLDEKGYVSNVSENLVEGVRLDDFEEDLRQGDGNELKEKFRAAHSSSALAVNTFAPFKANAAALRLPDGNGFANIYFERKCPHGIKGRRSPNLDVLADGSTRIFAIESKCLEHLSPHEAEFAPAYESHITDQRRRTGWFRTMQQLIEQPSTYRWLDAAQLVKHAYGVAFTYPTRLVTLLYLFWEPSNSEAYSNFAEHRSEVTRFAASTVGGGPEFVAMSYPELWRYWETNPSSEWLPVHVKRLRARYGVAA